MPSIRISHIHNSGLDRAKQVAEEVAIKISDAYDIQYYWEEDQVVFERTGIHGTIRIDDQEIEFDATLSMMLGMFKGTIEKAIVEELEIAFS